MRIAVCLSYVSLYDKNASYKQFSKIPMEPSYLCMLLL